MRLDQYISKKIWVSRNRAQFFISQEKIQVNGKIITKLSYEVKETDKVEENLEGINYVSRSALKLKWFLEEHHIDVRNTICLDVGASTGWFTQVLLEKWAQKVYALDVGTSQLHHTLRWKPQIISIENTDIRKFDTSFIREKLDFIVCDVSFISLHMILDSILNLMNADTKAILLFKPQFEVGKDFVTKLWVVKNEEIIQEVFLNFCLLLEKKWVKILFKKQSSLYWENGNKEIFLWIQKIWE